MPVSQAGEIGRVVAVLRRMPKQTVTRFTKVWNPILLRLVISFNLHTLRKEQAEEDPFSPSRRTRAPGSDAEIGRPIPARGGDGDLRNPGPGAPRPRA